MARKFYDLVKVTTATTGTGTITLGAAEAGFLSFVDAGATSGDLISYAIEEGTNREVGWGDYNGTTLTRNVYKSTNANAAISLAGSATVRIVLTAEDVKQTIASMDDYDNTHPATVGQLLVYDTSENKYRPGNVSLAPVAAVAGFTTIRLDLLTTNSNAFTITEIVFKDLGDITLTPSGVTAQTTIDGAASNMLDGNTTTLWTSNGNAETWVDFTFDVPVDPRSLLMTSAAITGNAIQAPENFNVLGSTDAGVTWTTISNITGSGYWAVTETRTFSLPDVAGLAPIYSLLADVDASAAAPTDGQVPIYNGATKKWHFGTPSTGVTSGGLTLTAGSTTVSTGYLHGFNTSSTATILGSTTGFGTLSPDTIGGQTILSIFSAPGNYVQLTIAGNVTTSWFDTITIPGIGTLTEAAATATPGTDTTYTWGASGQISSGSLVFSGTTGGGGTSSVGSHRYWKLANVVSYGNTYMAVSLQELQVFDGTTQLTVSSAYGSPMYGSNAYPMGGGVDGNTATEFALQEGGSITLDLGTASNVTELKFYTGSSGNTTQTPLEFRWCYSDDGTKYTIAGIVDTASIMSALPYGTAPAASTWFTIPVPT